MLALKEKEKERKACLHIPGSLGVSSFLLVPWSFLISSRLCFCSVYLGGGGGDACVTDRVNSGMGGGECHGAGV
jgi:hypothetical protein